MGRITESFQALSQEVIKLIGIFRDGGLEEVVKILEDLQKKEKEKLDLTVKWQVLLQKEQEGKEEGKGTEEAASACSSSDMEQEKNALKRKQVFQSLLHYHL